MQARILSKLLWGNVESTFRVLPDSALSSVIGHYFPNLLRPVIARDSYIVLMLLPAPEMNGMISVGAPQKAEGPAHPAYEALKRLSIEP